MISLCIECGVGAYQIPFDLGKHMNPTLGQDENALIKTDVRYSVGLEPPLKCEVLRRAFTDKTAWYEKLSVALPCEPEK